DGAGRFAARWRRSAAQASGARSQHPHGAAARRHRAGRRPPQEVVKMRALSLLLFPSLALAAGQFKIPDGWTDLTPGVAPESAYAPLDPAQRQTIQSGKYAFFAADIAHKTPTFMTNVNVTLSNEVPSIDQRFIDWYVTEMPKNSAFPRGASWRAL